MADNNVWGNPYAATSYKPPSINDIYSQPEYDVSSITGAIGGLKDQSYKPQNYSAAKFSTPGYAARGGYGMSSPQQISQTYRTAMNAATRPVMAQGAERMRSMAQGFGGGRFQGASQRELAMKNAMATGSNISDIGKTVGSGISDRMLSQEEFARSQDYQEAGNVRDTMFKAEQERQANQASEDFRAAGFNDSQARAVSDDIHRRMSSIGQLGFGLGNFQRGVNQDAMTMSNQLNNSLGKYWSGPY